MFTLTGFGDHTARHQRCWSISLVSASPRSICAIASICFSRFVTLFPVDTQSRRGMQGYARAVEIGFERWKQTQRSLRCRVVGDDWAEKGLVQCLQVSRFTPPQQEAAQCNVRHMRVDGQGPATRLPMMSARCASNKAWWNPASVGCRPLYPIEDPAEFSAQRSVPAAHQLAALPVLHRWRPCCDPVAEACLFGLPD